MADQSVDSGLYLSGIILTNLVGIKELTTKNGVGRSRRQMARVPGVATRKEVGEWSETGRRGVPASVPSKHCQNETDL